MRSPSADRAGIMSPAGSSSVDGFAPVGRHHVDLLVAVPERDERDAAAIGRPGRLAVSRSGRQLDRGTDPGAVDHEGVEPCWTHCVEDEPTAIRGPVGHTCVDVVVRDECHVGGVGRHHIDV